MSATLLDKLRRLAEHPGTPPAEAAAARAKIAAMGGKATSQRQQDAPRSDPFAGWDDVSDEEGYNGFYGEGFDQAAAAAANRYWSAAADNYQRLIKARSVALKTYSIVAPVMHDAGIDISPVEWEQIILNMLPS